VRDVDGAGGHPARVPFHRAAIHCPARNRRLAPLVSRCLIEMENPLMSGTTTPQRWLILTQYYPPEIGAPQIRLRCLARQLQRDGKQVSVLTAMPNYPAGKIFDGYRGRFSCRERIDGVDVRRTWVDAARELGFIRKPLLLRMAAFAEDLFLKNAWKVSTVTHAFMRHFESRGVPAERVTFLPNGADTDFLRRMEPSAEYLDAWKLHG